MDDDILDCMDFAEDKLNKKQKTKISKLEKQLKKQDRLYFCANSILIEQLYGIKLKEGQSLNTKNGLMVVCTNNIKNGSFFTNLDFSEEDLEELRKLIVKN